MPKLLKPASKPKSLIKPPAKTAPVISKPLIKPSMFLKPAEQSTRPSTYNLKKWPKPVGGRKDPSPEFSGHVLVPIENAPDIYPHVYGPMVPPNTFYRVDKETGRPECLLTLMPRNWRLAWSNCGVCKELSIHLCRCSRGVSASRCVEYLYDHDVADAKGEEWTMNHPAYLGSFHAKDRAERERNRDKLLPVYENRTTNPGPNITPSTAPSTKTGPKLNREVTAPPKKLLTPAKPGTLIKPLLKAGAKTKSGVGPDKAIPSGKKLLQRRASS